MDFDLDEVLKTLPMPGIDDGFIPADGIEFDLEETMDSMQKQRHESDVDLIHAPSKRKKILDQEAERQAAEESSSSHIRFECEDSLPNFGFSPTLNFHEMGIFWSLVTSTRARGIARHSADDIERTLAFYTERVVAMQMGLVESNRRQASELMALAEEKKKEAHHYKKKISYLKKSLETLEARALEQEIEIDNLRSILARAPKEAIERYKASMEYAKDLEAFVEQYKSSSDYAKALHSYGGKAMAASIRLAKEWVSTEHPSIDPSSFDTFLAQLKDKEGRAHQSKAFGHTSRGGSEGTSYSS